MPQNNEAFTEAIKHIYEWQYCHTDSFFNQLITLIAKADPTNRLRLAKAFPLEVVAYQAWCAAEDQDSFFKEQGLLP